MPAPGDLPNKSDAVIGNDVWIGHQALITPGVQIGNDAQREIPIVSSGMRYVESINPTVQERGQALEVVARSHQGSLSKPQPIKMV